VQISLDAVETIEVDGSELTLREVQAYVQSFDTDAELSDFLATLDDAELESLLSAHEDEREAAAFIAAALGGTALLVAILSGANYRMVRVETPDDWQSILGGGDDLSRIVKARQMIAESSGEIIGDVRLGELRDDIDALFRDRARQHGQDLIDGVIDLEEFHERMVGDIARGHLVQRKLAQGRMSPRDINDLRQTVEDQLRYFQKFVQDIADGKISERQLLNRAGRYGGNSGFSFNQGRAEILEREAAYKQRFLGACSPHCQPCIDYQARGRVSINDSLPFPRQRCDCRERCCCTLLFYDAMGEPVGFIT
jgi:hypothetical protein